jgi:hypothetical protein
MAREDTVEQWSLQSDAEKRALIDRWAANPSVFDMIPVAAVRFLLTALAAAEAERDEARAEVTRLAALETAAIAYRAWWVAYDGLEGNLVEGHRLLTELRQATAALAAPAGQPS